MTPSEIGKAYDQITHLWSSGNFNMNNGIAAHNKALEFVQNGTRALDIGCGCTGRFIDLLRAQGFLPTGLDVSFKKLELAKQRHPNVDFVHSDICSYPLSTQYDFITAWDSIWHIPLKQQKSVITKIVESLNPGGVFIFSFGGTDEPGEHIDDFMGVNVYYSSLGTNGFVQLLISLGCQIKHLEYDQHPELHTYLIVQKSE
ncbi:class I SAM-dependent methyltransferase [Vibrio maerlii]|uniref:class I SAM-dependent methyltransferase n=1 Tax=Vibrio maerlii TaxID=2231648 RepID=UPI000E3CAD2C|nr:class I SAM-dependent methyltransferase [Vibrio maerlii]